MLNHTSRRGFMKTMAAGCVTSASLHARQSHAAKRKPNLLILWTDEQRADTMAAYGNSAIHAPNLNRLANESVVFDKAYVTQPVCTPSRSTVMTGLWPHTNGCIENNVPLRTETPCIPELVNDPAYRTAYMGKWHLGDEIFAQHGFDEWVSIEDNYTPHYSSTRDRDLRSDYHHWLVDKGYAPDKKDKFSRGYAAKRPIEHCKPKFLEEKVCGFLREHKDKPFILSVNFLEPHMPFFGPLDDEHDPKDVTLPVNFRDPLEENEPLRYRLKREVCRKNYGDTERQIRSLIAKYWGLVTQVDRSVGAILDELESLGLADNTIIVYTSDHGDMMGAHNLVAKGVMYEEAVRVPWLMRVPQLGKKQKHITQPVSHIDLVPTLLDLMNVPIPDTLQGQSLVPLMRGEHVEEDHVFIEWSVGKRASNKLLKDFKKVSKENVRNIVKDHTRTVVSPDGWKLCLSSIDKSQLFNLNEDSGETTNLIDSGQHDDVITRLTKKIRAWQRRTGDTLKLPG